MIIINILTLYLTSHNKDTLPIDRFDRKEMFNFLDWLTRERGIGPRTRNNYKDYVRTLFTTLVDRGVVNENPASKVKDLPTKSGRYIIFTDNQKDVLEQHLQRHNPRLFLFTRFIYYGFMRPVEVCRMQVRNIDVDKRIILVRNNQSKNKKQKPVVINPQLLSVIKELGLEKYPEHYYVFGRNRMTSPHFRKRNRYSEDHRKALDACGIDDPDLDMYSWKHTGNCNAYTKGKVDINSLKIQNRHGSLKQTEIYLTALGLRIPVELKTKEW
ncbi:MAG: site-specific integrase [Bacteroidota bacterium]